MCKICHELLKQSETEVQVPVDSVVKLHQLMINSRLSLEMPVARFL